MLDFPAAGRRLARERADDARRRVRAESLYKVTPGNPATFVGVAL